jgi:hypothetical protein
MKFNVLKTRRGKLKAKIEEYLKRKDIEGILEAVDTYEKDNLETIEKLKRKRHVEMNRINGALKQSINAHSVITKELIGSASKRIMGALLVNEKSKKEKICDKISSIYHTFVYVVIFILKLKFMKINKEKISISISKTNNERLNDKSINKSKLIDRLLSEYFKKGEDELRN